MGQFLADIFNKLTNLLERRWLRNEADRLIWESALENWKLISVNFFTGILAALFEGGTFATIFFSVSLLSSSNEIDWSQYRILTSFPLLTTTLNSLPVSLLFLTLLSIAVVTQICLGVCNYFNSTSSGELGIALQVKFTEYLHRHILSFSFSCASRYKVGDLTSYASAAGPTVKNQITIFTTLVSNLWLSLLYLAILITISPWLLLAAAFLSLFFWILQYQLLPQIKKTSLANEQGLVEVNKQVTENLQGLRVLHTIGHQSIMIDKVRQLVADVQPSLRRQVYLTNLLQPIAQTLPIILLAIITACSFLLFSQRSTGILPNLLTFVVALQRFNIRLQAVNSAYTSLARNSGALQRFQEILNPQDKVFVRRDGIEFVSLSSDIQFENISLRYSPNQEWVLRDINLTLPFGTVTALVGPSGAGKSSLADLLVGLYEPTEGIIRINDRDLQEFSPSSWRQHLGVVSQDTFMFNVSILDNIRLTCPNATDSEVIHAAQTAQAHDFIQNLPMGYGTVVGERGYRLSGGQRQRIALARAILSNPDLLILDEATSALDSVCEYLVQQALDDFAKERTVLVIAHRLSTIVNANQIVMIQQGRIVEQGTHSELLKFSGLYCHVWKLQSGNKSELVAS